MSTNARQNSAYFSFSSALNKFKSTNATNRDRENEQISNSNNNTTAHVLLNTYSTKKYAKWFAIVDTKMDESDTFTIYKVIYRFVPNDINENTKELAIWKRFKDFKDLHKILSKFHASLHRRQVFPEFIKSIYFGRFDTKTIEERKECILRLLQFCATQPHLYTHDKFIEFFSEGKITDHIIKSDNKLLQPLVPSRSSNEKVSSSSSLIDNSKVDNNVPIQKQQPIPQQEQAILQQQQQIDSEKIYADLTDLIKLNDTYGNTSSDYIKKALAYIQEAIFNEKMRSYFASFDLYKLAVATLIKGIQNESAQTRIQIIKENTKQLLIKAEQIITLNQSTTTTTTTATSTEMPIHESLSNTSLNQIEDDLNRWKIDLCKYTHELEPFLSKYCGSLSELSENFYIQKVLLNQHNNTLFLIKNKNDNLSYIIKTKLKTSSSIVTNDKQKSIVPFFNQKIKYMCKLHKYYESEFTLYLLLEYKKYSKLYNYYNFNSSSDKSDDYAKLKSISSFTCLASTCNEFNSQYLNHLPFLNNKECTTSEQDDNIDVSIIFDGSKTKLFLAQILCALESLHSIGIICKDLRSDNILLDDEYNVCLTYFSQWNLVDDLVNEDAVRNLYVAPEISSFINNEITDACDWWSFGIICYELLTLNKFIDLNFENNYMNKINFPKDTDQIVISLINQLVQINPKSRLTVDKIKSHEFFKGINWSNL